MNEEISQREFVRSSTAGIFVERKACQPLMTRGINLYQEDIGTVAQWPQTAKDAGQSLPDPAVKDAASPLVN